VDCKKRLAECINEYLGPLRERRTALAANPQYIKEVLADGASRARVMARDTLDEVKQKMGLL
jgi:tryptophanyl-tRNA synthetase